jgi:hypothetical protein
MILQIPADAKTIEMSSSVLWFDNNGILYSRPKESAPISQSIEDIRTEMKKLREFLGGKKVCMIIESNSKASSPPKNQRDVIEAELNSITKAMAIISTSPLSRMVANLFFSFKPPQYPFKMFSNEEEAFNWVKQYL